MTGAFSHYASQLFKEVYEGLARGLVHGTTNSVLLARRLAKYSTRSELLIHNLEWVRMLYGKTGIENQTGGIRLLMTSSTQPILSWRSLKNENPRTTM